MRFFFACAAAFLLTTCSSESDLSWDRVLQAGELRIGIVGSIHPMHFYDPLHNQETGFEVEMAREVSRRLGVRPVFQRIFWAEKFRDLQSNRLDCIWSTLSITPNRSRNALFSRPYLFSRQLVLVRSDSPFQHIRDLAHANIGYLQGSSVQDTLLIYSRDSISWSLTAYSHPEVGLMQLAAGMEQAFVMDEVIAVGHVRSAGNTPHPLRVLPGDFGTDSLGVAFRLTDAALQMQVQSVLNEMKSDGTLSSLYSRWLGVSTAQGR